LPYQYSYFLGLAKDLNAEVFQQQSRLELIKYGKLFCGKPLADCWLQSALNQLLLHKYRQFSAY